MNKKKLKKGYLLLENTNLASLTQFLLYFITYNGEQSKCNDNTVLWS